jgi:hypothetical protein
MNDSSKRPMSISRRRLLQSAAGVAAAGVVAPVLGNSLMNETGLSNTGTEITGRLVSKIGSRTKSLLLKNNTSETISFDQFEQSAFMFDGELIDCNAACISEPISVSAHQEVVIQFDSHQAPAMKSPVGNIIRAQSSVQRLSEGTRVIPFNASITKGRAALSVN